MKELEILVNNHPKIFQGISGLGLMIGLKCSIENTLVIKQSLENFLILVPCGENMVRLLPPLNITEEDLLEGLSRLDIVAKDLEKGL